MINKYKYLLKHWKIVAIYLLAIVLFFIPQLLWKDYGYKVGGDDSLLHYMYPNEMIDNYAQNIAVNNKISGPKEYSERLHLLPLLYLISFVKYATGVSNTLYIFLGFIVSASFLSFFALLNEILPRFRNQFFNQKIFISLFYTFAVHHYLSVMSHKLLVMYIVFLIPFSLALFSRAIIRKKPILLIPCALVVSLFAVVLMGVPWLLGYLICSLGIFLYLFVQFPKRFIDYSIRLISLLFLMNIYWVFHFILAIVTGTQNNVGFAGILTKEFRDQNVLAILMATSHNLLSDSMLGFFHPNMRKIYNSAGYAIYENWHSHLLILNTLVLSFIIATALFYRRKKYVQLFPFAILGWLVALYFFTVNMFGTYGTQLFLLMNNFIPGFSMFRNNYDKFGSGFAFAFSIIIFATTIQIATNRDIPKAVTKIWFVILTLFTILTIIPSFRGDFERNYLSSEEGVQLRVESLDEKFINFTNELKQLENKSIMWMPLNKASYIVVKDDRKENYYFVGNSPLSYLSNVHDYAGILSFNNKEAKELSMAIESRSAVNFGEVLKQMGITHIAVNNTISNDVKNSYIYGKDFLEKQDESFMNEFLGTEIISVDDAFVLYKVKDRYYQEQFYFKDGCQVTNIEMISREKYKISYFALDSNNTDNCQLIFKYPFSELWVLKDGETEKSSISTESLQNSWKINKRSGEVIVYFKPREWVMPLFCISGITALLSSLFFIWKIVKQE